MEAKREGAWLSKQISTAKSSKESWPNWMKKAARFEGSTNSRPADVKQRCCRVGGQVK